MVHIHNGILLSQKKHEITPLAAAQMNLEIIILKEVSQTRERQISYAITYKWNIKYDPNEPIYETESRT